MTEILPRSVQNYIDKYFNLDILGTEVRAPYFRNVKRIRGGLRSLVGKGSPAEIEEETIIYAKLREFYFTNKSEEEIRKFMISQGIGIDCSGFAAQIIDFWLKDSGAGGIQKHLNYVDQSLKSKIFRNLRVIENISANLITSDINNKKVNIKDIKPGDLLRLRGAKRGFHVAMIYKVEKSENNKFPESITYVHSTEHYGDKNGVRFGEIHITDDKKTLKEQDWLEIDPETHENYTYQGYLRDEEDNGIRRPNFSELLQWN